MQTTTNPDTSVKEPAAPRSIEPGAVLDAVAIAVLAAALALAANQVFAFLPSTGPAGAVTIGVASLLILASALLADGPKRRPWLLIGAGIAVAEAARFAADLFPAMVVAGMVAAGFGAIVWGLAALPHVTSTRFGAIRVVLDALAATFAIGVLVWEYGPAPADQSEGFYTLLNVFLLGALVFAALRRSPYRLDRRLLTLSFAFVAWASLDFFAESAAGDSLLLLAAGSLAVTSWFLRRPLARVDKSYLRPPVWVTILPYTAILPLAVVLYLKIGSTPDLGLIPAGTAVVAALLIARQAVFLREMRDLVEAERDQLILSVAHELRTPMTAVAGFVDILSDDEIELPESERRDMFAIVRDSSAHINQLVGDMVALIRNRLDSATLIRERVDARQVIGEAITSFFDVRSGPPPVKAQVEAFTEFVADRQRLRQIIIGMLSNAHRYGGGKILVVARRGDDERILEVHDNGPGLPPKYEQVVWERFERGANQLNDRVPGSGLGLSIIGALMTAHGGSAGYRRSEKLGGACFWVSFPHS